MFIAPNQFTNLSSLLDQLPTSDRARICKFLDVTPRTFAKWESADWAPRLAMLALFYESHHGRNAIHRQADNDARHFAQQAAMSERHIAALQARVGRLLAFLESRPGESANSPFYDLSSAAVPHEPVRLVARSTGAVRPATGT